MKRVSIFGATGSIGQQTIDLIRREREAYDVVALSGGQNIAHLAALAVELDADIAVSAFDACYGDLKEALSGSRVQAAAGPPALVEAAMRPTDWVMSAIVGPDGLAPGLAALENCKTLALANKESLVTAGPLVMEVAARCGTTIVPVDSEHSAIFQILLGETGSSVERVVLTASGGAFRDWPIEELKAATAQEAATHPNWHMGKRITIDSASMFNKALELIETKEFFGYQSDQIEVLIHPESLVHAFVGFSDGALMAHVGPHDMRHAIGFALNYPVRRNCPVERLDLAQIGQLTFAEADPVRYPALQIARDVMEMGGLAGAAMISAKEAALDAFIAQRIRFTDMAPIVASVLDKLSAQGHIQGAITLDTVVKTNQVAHEAANDIIRQKEV